MSAVSWDVICTEVLIGNCITSSSRASCAGHVFPTRPSVIDIVMAFSADLERARRVSFTQPGLQHRSLGSKMQIELCNDQPFGRDVSIFALVRKVRSAAGISFLPAKVNCHHSTVVYFSWA